MFLFVFTTRFAPAFQIEALQLNEARRWVNRNGTARIIFRFEVELFVQKAVLQVWGGVHVLEAHVEKATAAAFLRLRHDLVGKLRAWQVHCHRRAEENSRTPLIYKEALKSQKVRKKS